MSRLVRYSMKSFVDGMSAERLRELFGFMSTAPDKFWRFDVSTRAKARKVQSDGVKRSSDYNVV